MLNTFANRARHGDLGECLYLQMIDERQPFSVYLYRWIIIRFVFTEVADFHMAEHVKTALLQIVHKIDERTRGSWTRHQQQHLRSPEFHVIFSRIQHQQILAHLMEHQRLRNGTRVRLLGNWRENVQTNDQNQAHNDTERCVDCIDHKHHDQCAHQSEEARVPREVFECGPEIWGTGDFDSETRKICCHIR